MAEIGNTYDDMQAWLKTLIEAEKNELGEAEIPKLAESKRRTRRHTLHEPRTRPTIEKPFVNDHTPIFHPFHNQSVLRFNVDISPGFTVRQNRPIFSVRISRDSTSTLKVHLHQKFERMLNETYGLDINAPDNLWPLKFHFHDPDKSSRPLNIRPRKNELLSDSSVVLVKLKCEFCVEKQMSYKEHIVYEDVDGVTMVGLLMRVQRSFQTYFGEATRKRGEETNAAGFRGDLGSQPVTGPTVQMNNADQFHSRYTRPRASTYVAHKKATRIPFPSSSSSRNGEATYHQFPIPTSESEATMETTASHQHSSITYLGPSISHRRLPTTSISEILALYPVCAPDTSVPVPPSSSVYSSDFDDHSPPPLAMTSAAEETAAEMPEHGQDAKSVEPEVAQPSEPHKIASTSLALLPTRSKTPPIPPRNPLRLLKRNKDPHQSSSSGPPKSFNQHELPIPAQLPEPENVASTSLDLSPTRSKTPPIPPRNPLRLVKRSGNPHQSSNPEPIDPFRPYEVPAPPAVPATTQPEISTDTGIISTRYNPMTDQVQRIQPQKVKVASERDSSPAATTPKKGSSHGDEAGSLATPERKKTPSLFGSSSRMTAQDSVMAGNSPRPSHTMVSPTPGASSLHVEEMDETVGKTEGKKPRRYGSLTRRGSAMESIDTPRASNDTVKPTPERRGSTSPVEEDKERTAATQQAKKKGWLASLSRRSARSSGAAGMPSTDASTETPPPVPERRGSNVSTDENAQTATESKQPKNNKWFASLGRRGARRSGLAGSDAPQASNDSTPAVPERSDDVAPATHEVETNDGDREKRRWWFGSRKRTA